MSPADLAAAIAALPDDAQVTLTLRKRDLAHALTTRGPAPSLLTTEQAANRHGCTADWWRRRANAGDIPQAFQREPGGPWQLPDAECEALIVRLRARGHSRPTRAPVGDATGEERAAGRPVTRREARGPRSSQHRPAAPARPSPVPRPDVTPLRRDEPPTARARERAPRPRG